MLTLGDSCPSCGKRFERRGAADRFPDFDWLIETPWGLATLGLVLSTAFLAVVFLLNRI